MRRRIWSSLAVALVGVAVMGGPALAGTASQLPAASPCSGQTAPAHASTGPASGLALFEGTSSYVDFQRNTHLLGEVIDNGATVEQPIAVIDLLNADGSTMSQVSAYLPVGWLEPGEMAPFDYPVAAGGGFTGKWQVDHFEGLVSQVVPSHDFMLQNVVISPSGSSAILTGEARNDNAYPVNLIKVAASFYDSCGIIYAEPTVVNANTQLIAPGQSYPFTLPKQTGAPSNIDPNNRSVIVEANEPGASYPLTDAGVLAAGGKLTTVKATVPSFLKIESHTPKTDTSENGVPNPTVSDLAGAAHPGRVVPQHDSKPVNHGSDTAQALVGVSDKPAAPRTSAAYAPILLIAMIGAFGLLTAFRNAAVGVSAFRNNRRARREAVSTHSPGAVGGYGAMPGAER